MAKQFYVGDNMNPGAMNEVSKMPDDLPFAIIILFKFKEWAEYPEGTVTEKLTGRQAYERYRKLAIPCFRKVGGVPIWRGGCDVILIGPEDVHWDETLIVQFPARSAFEHMMADPKYQEILFHRTAAVQDIRCFGSISPEFIGPRRWRIFNLLQIFRS